jgi:hypothetical protein
MSVITMSAKCQKQTLLSCAPSRLLLEQREGTGIKRPVLLIWTDRNGSGILSCPDEAACWKCASAYVSCPFLLLKIIGTLWLCRQLKHRRLLSLS